MASIGELRKRVEAEPESHDVRWQLAKKLYAESSYREALAHLRVLKNDWDRRLNVLRYLAAAYYRLGRYDEAISELTDCIDTWPEEVSLFEQLAKVYSAAGRTREASEVWQGLLKLDPSNRMARKALKRIDERASMTPYPATEPHESDDGVDLRPVTVCPRCGAQNSAEFERCWQCGSALNGADTPPPFAEETRAGGTTSHAVVSRLLTALLIGMLAGSLYLTVRYAPLAFSDSAFVEPPRTVAEVLLRELTAARLTLWVGLLVLCPITIIAGANLLKIRDLGVRQIAGLSIGLATAVYLGSWLSVQYLYLAIASTILLLIPAVVWTLGANAVKSGVMWLLLVTATAAATAGVFFLYVGKGPFEQAQAIAEFARAHDAQPDPGVHPTHSFSAPARFEMTWISTGSQWLDGHTNETAVIVTSEPVSPPARFEFYIGDDLKDFLEMTQAESRLRMRVQAGVPYRVVLRGAEGTEAELRTVGVLTPVINREVRESP